MEVHYSSVRWSIFRKRIHWCDWFNTSNENFPMNFNVPSGKSRWFAPYISSPKQTIEFDRLDETLWKCLHLPVLPLAIFQQKQKSFVFTHISAHIHFSHCLFVFFLRLSLLVLSDQVPDSDVGLEPHIVAVTNGCANCLPKLYQSCNQPPCLCSTTSTGQVPKFSGENRFGPSRIEAKKIETSLQRKRKQVHLNVMFIQYAWIVQPGNLWAVFLWVNWTRKQRSTA